MLILSNAKLLQNLQRLADFIGRVDVGGESTFLSNSLKLEDIESNDTVCFLSGANYGEDCTVMDFENGQITIYEDFTITRKDTFGIVKIPFDSYIKQAEYQIKEDFKNKGADIALFLNTTQLEMLHTYKTISLICGDRRNGSDTNDSYNSDYMRFNDLYMITFNNLLADYDSNEDGVIDTDEELIFKGQVGFDR